jgi:hypothetical protein
MDMDSILAVVVLFPPNPLADCVEAVISKNHLTGE